MTKSPSRPTNTVVAGITTDYLDFWCQECGEEFTAAWRFSAPDILGVQLEGECGKCGASVLFKLRVTPALVPRGYRD